ncbi:ribonuclease E/G family protein [Sandaracinobacteroides hominis]|uniref:ribonuclease n=1 Tax=Sandaracinobacteroides hominis TaxID=2780086 RepID=UPI0018F38B3D|nr:ribonuclease [Sandaracinobacteroides hominis]
MADLYLAELIGETRAALFEGGRLVEMHIARDGDGLAAGARVQARLVKKLGTRGIAEADGQELLVQPWPAGATEGATVTVEVVRAAWRETGRDRLAKARPTQLAPWPAPGLESALAARGARRLPGWPADVAGQWDDAFEAAQLGLLRFDTGSLLFEATPAFTAVDVDGHGISLARPALAQLARAIRLWGLGGSIVIDVPAADKDERAAAADGFDKAMGKLSFERTAINGFGLMQVVRPRIGPSILERARIDRAGTQAVAILAAALGDRATGPLLLRAPAAAEKWLSARPHLIAELAARTHRAVELTPDSGAEAGDA